MGNRTWVERYQLRQAAGAYWLLDMDQPGIPYRKPLQVNEVGADIWRYHVQQGFTTEETAARMSVEYGVPPEVILPDIGDFLRMLAQHGILPEGRGEEKS